MSGLLPTDLLDEVPGFDRVVATATAGGSLHAGGLWGSSQAYLLTCLQARAQGPWLVTTSTEAEAEALLEDLNAFGAEPVLLPARQTLGAHRSAALADPDSVRRRLQVVQRIAGPPERRPRILIASLRSLLQPIPSSRDLEGGFLHVVRGQRLDTTKLIERLVGAGFGRQPLAERPGEVSLRGDILDVFPFAADMPVRIELFDDEVESLRVFDPETQRSVEPLDRVALCVANDVGGIEDGEGVPVCNMLSPTTVFVDVEPLRIADQAEGMRIQSTAHKHALNRLEGAAKHRARIALQSLPGNDVDFATLSVQSLSVGLKQAPSALREVSQEGRRIVVLFRTEPEQRHFQDQVDEEPPIPGLELALGSIGCGFRFPALNTLIINQRELTGVLGGRARVRTPKTHHVRALQSFFELKVGDLVVHAVHGVAQYAGLRHVERSGGEEEHLHLVFANDVSMFVPASRIELVQRYVGSGNAAPNLDRVGGTSFRKRKEKVERALVDLSAELLRIQAARETQSRPAWEPDLALVRDLQESFPYEDTRDQVSVDREIAGDLGSSRPMDRLLCGDVGFGKTELAIRAAFRVVSAGAQVAVLVPTTVLAEQHYQTFRERLAAFAVEVGVLSRYTSTKASRSTLQGVEEGKIDILVGTHRILSKDVSFKSLGLVIIDEEQRFGVKHKEHYKDLRASVDVLALSATPIPRTLHMSLSGIRDISALSEPPEGRQEIETSLAHEDDQHLIREAILREKNREGQTFFLHNRVQTIEARARMLMDLVPECSFAVGHGQMRGQTLRSVMDGFTRGDVDVLVATTIIENGIDIPTAGTIILDRADRFGLAELHQLRGRVGRGRSKASCYLLIDRARPVGQEARMRLKALEELTQLGAGFQISMKDLELRGAGNILGPEQSGHIAAVGYDMYCRLLKETVDRMSAGAEANDEFMRQVPEAVQADLEGQAIELELGLAAYLPKSWLPSADDRVRLLRKLAGLQSDVELDKAREELRDLHGRIPPPAQELLRQFRMRPRLAQIGVRKLLWRQETYFIQYTDRVLIEEVLSGRQIELRPLRAGQAHLVIPPEQRRDASTALGWLEGLLSRVKPAHTLSPETP